jgi:hypothetical protein
MSGYAFHSDAFADLDEIGNTSQKTTSMPPTGFSPTSNRPSPPSRDHHRSDIDARTSPQRPLRFHVVRDEYVIAYAFAEKPLWVLAVFHGHRNRRLMAAVLRDRE